MLKKTKQPTRQKRQHAKSGRPHRYSTPLALRPTQKNSGRINPKGNTKRFVLFSKRLNSLSLTKENSALKIYIVQEKNIESEHSALCCFMFNSQYTSALFPLLVQHWGIKQQLKKWLKLWKNRGRWRMVRKSNEAKKTNLFSVYLSWTSRKH